MIRKHIFLITFLNEPELIFCTQLNGSKYCYESQTIHLNISHLFTQLNDQTFLFLTIPFRLSPLFVLSLNVKHFYLTHC